MSSSRTLPALAALAALVAVPSLAAAHISLTNPTPRTTASIKTRPCGAANSVRGAVPAGNVFAPGATVDVRWTETVGHPGHFRISFDLDGQDFTIPLTYNDATQSINVLKDSIPSRATTGAMYTQTITLPNQACENCTLRRRTRPTRCPTTSTSSAPTSPSVLPGGSTPVPMRLPDRMPPRAPMAETGRPISPVGAAVARRSRNMLTSL